jgi:hypothetical protein
LYKVIKHFVDLQDNNHKYDIGDTYPRKGLNVLQSRINELASNKNLQKIPLIEEVEEKKVKKSEKTDEE